MMCVKNRKVSLFLDTCLGLVWAHLNIVKSLFYLLFRFLGGKWLKSYFSVLVVGALGLMSVFSLGERASNVETEKETEVWYEKKEKIK
jgi:hypothetical protein